MSRTLRGAYALTLAALVSSAATAQQPMGANLQEPGQNVLLAGYSDCPTCDEYGPCDCDMGCAPGGGLCSRTQFFVGGEYLSIRSNFSEATAYLDTDLSTNSFTLVQFDSDYEGSYRGYVGMRLCQCGAEMRFTYSNINTGGSFDSGLLDTNSGTRSFDAPFEVITAGDGDQLIGDASVDLEDYDLGFSKTIPLGSPLGCGCADECCCDPCAPRCPAWDITWTGALRATNYESRLTYQSIIDPANSSVVSPRNAESVVSFDGIGVRTGLIGRRYIGKQGIASVYVKGDISLLLGEVDYYAQGTTVSRTQISTTEVIPVTEIEVGGTVFLTSNLTVSGGYLLSAWHDLGHRAQYDFGATGIEILSMDDANMMMLDGFFARVEAIY